MAREQVLVIDGSAPPVDSVSRQPGRAAVRRVLLDLLAERGTETRMATLDPARQAHCIGCFHCWLEEPGICRYHDPGAEILRAIAACDTLVVLSPLTFGGYSAAAKQVLDRMLGLLLPDFEVTRGELAHPWRYARAPRLIGIGVTDQHDRAAAAFFTALVGRTARNLRTASHASVVVATDEPPGAVRVALEAALSRVETIPTLAEIERLLPVAKPQAPPVGPSGGHASLLIGSPRQLSRSTSAVLGMRLDDGLRARGWTSERLFARDMIRREEGRTRLCDAAEHSELLVLCFPLYWDTPPYVLIRALEILSAHRASDPRPGVRRLVAIVNASFPQAAQASLAIGICARFAEAAGFEWSGALAVGTGAIIDGQPLTGPGRSIRPVGHVIRALDRTATALAAGGPVPADAAEEMARTPIRGLPMGAWQWLYASLANRELRRRAARHAIGSEAYTARPYVHPRPGQSTGS